MRSKADTGESNTGLFKEVKLNRDRPRHRTTESACRSPHSPKVLVSRLFLSVRGGGVLAPFYHSDK
jgi:hypothetical protein